MAELVILAAGIGSRYGGPKQIDPMGPHDQTILDYSIYDAIQAGFKRVVFIIRKDLEADFKGFFGNRYEKSIPCEYVLQELDCLPSGYAAPAHRTKPWGTGQAVWVCKSFVQGPFAVINADDFYGRTAYEEIHRFLQSSRLSEPKPLYALVSFILSKTISDHGSVARGICAADAEDRLISVTERTKIGKQDDRIGYVDVDDSWHPLTGQEPVSMNFWGFTPGVFDFLEERFKAFLETEGDNPKAEFYLPKAVDYLLSEDRIDVTVLKSQDQWTGVTNPGDKPRVVDHLKELTRQGVYPENLWAQG